MPRYAYYQLRWSEQAQHYLLSAGDQVNTQAFTSDWLARIASFSFHSRSSMHYTARKQRGRRGDSYWYAYRRLHGRIVKRYLGRTADLTFARLEEIARLLESTPQARRPPSETRSARAASPSVDASQPSILPLLFSKLSPPRLHPLLLDRARLFELLDAGRAAHLTLVSAPAGFGKTTLVCQWIAARRTSPDFPPVAWVSLEAADNDPARFWRYLITACQAFQVDLQEAHRALLDATPQPPFVTPSLEIMLTTLLNVLDGQLSSGVLVLEDYHTITSPQTHKTISFFLDHLPATLHLIIITRSDPPFSLVRLRARNTVCEIRTADLRFSQEEIAILFHQVFSFPLDAGVVEHLHTQLEGWATGLYLMKLTFQRIISSAEGEQTVMLFPGNSAVFREYFVREVLDTQPAPVQQFLLQTSMLTRLTSSLCDAVTEQQNGEEMLALLERVNLFLEPLDAAGQWYRYHTLFAEAMRNEARRRLGEDWLRCLSARASHWYEAHGYSDESIEAALDARDYMRAANFIERSIEEHTFPGAIYEPHSLHRWLKQLPETTLEQKPVLCLSYATTLLLLSASWLPDALTLRLLATLLRSAEQRFLTENDLPRLGELSAFRSLLALRQGDTQAAMVYAKQALERLLQTQQIWRGLSLSIVAEEWIGMGHFQKAHAALQESRALCEAVKNRYFQRVATVKLAQVLFEQGKTRRATLLYRQVLVLAREEKHLYVLCNALSGLATLSYEYNELEDAHHYAEEAITISRSSQLVYHEARATLILARVQQAQGQSVVAQQQLAALLDKVPASLSDLLQEIQMAQARIAFTEGDQMAIQRWASSRSPLADFSQQIEEELLVSRWLRTQGKLEDATALLERLLATAQDAGNTRRMLGIQVEMVLIATAEKRKVEAQELLREVLVLAFDANAVRLFLDAGEQVAILLRSLLPQLHDHPLRDYVRALLPVFPDQQRRGTQAHLIEPLSPQELRVLRLLVQRRSNAEIARELVVSVNTVRTQVQSIYSKLGVHTRLAASDVARELCLIS